MLLVLPNFNIDHSITFVLAILVYKIISLEFIKSTFLPPRTADLPIVKNID